MQSHRTDTADNGVVVASGYGLKIHVNGRHLIVHDGVGRNRRTRRYHRITSRLERLLVLGHSGFVTLEAMRWIRDAGAAFAQLDSDAQLVTLSTAPAPSVAGLRRAQALAQDNPAGVEVARAVLVDKLRGQSDIQAELPATLTERHALTVAVADAQAAGSLDELLVAEAQGAAAYWAAWSDVEVQFGPRESDVPEHWRLFSQRRSPLSVSTRDATNPANAILNYLYALLEIETTLACHTVSLDPGLGIFHVDRRARDSLSLDLMEAVRPAVDAYVLTLLRERIFRRRDFIETRRGACRLTPPIADSLATTRTTWASLIAPTAEQCTQLLTGIGTPTPLTQGRRRDASNAVHGTISPPGLRTPALPFTCRRCGEPLADRRRRECKHCSRDRLQEVAAKGRSRAAQVLATMRAEGRDPAHGGHAAQSRGRKNASHQRAVVDWNSTNEPADPAEYASRILPALGAVDITDLAAATGLSETYCSLIRLGKRIPHPRHWEALRHLVAR